MKQLYKNAFLILTLIIIWSCSDGSQTQTLSRLGIEDATNLFIATSSSSAHSARSSTGVNTLFKITEDGYIEEVSYYDEIDGEMRTSIMIPSDIYNVNDEYVIVAFGASSYLVRKTDGAVFSIYKSDDLSNISHLPQSENFINAEVIQSDNAGNIYFMADDYSISDQISKVIKIDTTSPESLTKSDYTPDTDNIRGFNITPEGHISYSYGIDSNYRIKKSNGGLYNLPTSGYLSHWIGLDGNIKYINQGVDPDTIVTVNIDSNTFEVTTSEISGSLDYISGYSSYLLKSNNRVIAVDIYGDYVNELENPSNTPQKITISEIDDIKNVDYSSNYYYLSGNDSSYNPLLLKVDLTDDTVSTLLTPGLYDIFTMSVSSDDTVIFHALRMTDGVKVFGEIDSLGTVTILDETFNTEIVILERIN